MSWTVSTTATAICRREDRVRTRRRFRRGETSIWKAGFRGWTISRRPRYNRGRPDEKGTRKLPRQGQTGTTRPGGFTESAGFCRSKGLSSQRGAAENAEADAEKLSVGFLRVYLRV